MKQILIILIFSFGAFQGFAQDKEQDKLKAIRVALITQEAKLTVEQSEKFWSLYNEYEKERDDLQNQTKMLRRMANQEQLTDKELKDNFNKRFDIKKEQVELEKRYMNKFLKVVSISQYASMFKVERQLKRKIINELKERRKNKHKKQHKK